MGGGSLQAKVLPGIDVLLRDYHRFILHQRVGLVTNHAGVDAVLVSSIERLYNDPKVELVALFAPEHGIRGVAQAGVALDDDTDAITGLPIYSLYGNKQRPIADVLRGIDLLVVDLPDVGARYWTNLAITIQLMRTCAENRIAVMILDRPNPITGVYVEGNVLSHTYASIVGCPPFPNRTGMTLGEAALLANEYHNIQAELTVIPAANWRRSMWFDETGLFWVAPSPNMPTLDTALVYPGTCLFEGTNISERRGTTKPFEMIGAPWLDGKALAEVLNGHQLPGVRFRPAAYVPMFSKHQGEVCFGVQVHISDRNVFRPLLVGISILTAVYEQCPERFAWLESTESGHPCFIDLLTGSQTFRASIEQGKAPGQIWHEWDRQLVSFMSVREKYLLYD